MDVVVAIALAAGFAWLISSISTQSLNRAVAALSQLVGGWRPDGWPRGVQEEDRDRPWGRSAMASNSTGAEREVRPRLIKVRPTMSAR